MSSKGLQSGHVTAVAPPGRSMSEMALVNGLASVSKVEVMKMNLMAIRKMDGQVSSIVKTVPRVILYQYEKATNTWVRHIGNCLTCFGTEISLVCLATVDLLPPHERKDVSSLVELLGLWPCLPVT